MEKSASPRFVVAIVMAGLGVLGFITTAKQMGSELAGSLSAAAWLLVPLAGTALVSRGGVLKELGVTRWSSQGVAVALLGSLGMYAGLAFEGGSPEIDLEALWRGALRPGVLEEVVFRGFAFGLLYWRARWSFTTALLTQGLLFGAFHLPGALQKAALGEALNTVAITSAGGCWFAWLYLRWGRSLWVPVAAHTAMNAWWVLFAAGATAGGGGSGATWGRVLAITLITVGTIRRTSPTPDDENTITETFDR